MGVLIMLKVRKTFMATTLAGIIAVSATGCGETPTVFDNVEQISTITEGEFTLSLGANVKGAENKSASLADVDTDMGLVMNATQNTGAITATCAGKMEGNNVDFVMQNISFDMGDMTMSIKDFNLLFVDNILYIPTDDIKQIVTLSGMSDTSAVDAITMPDGSAVEWFSITMDTVLDQTEMSETEVDEEKVNEIKNVMITTVLPEIEESFGALEGDILFEEDGKAHFKITNESTEKFLVAFKSFVEDGSLQNVADELNKVMELEGEEALTLNTETAVSDIDKAIESLKEMTTTYVFDLATSMKNNVGTMGITAEVAEENGSSYNITMNYEVTNCDVEITAPTNGVYDLSTMM